MPTRAKPPGASVGGHDLLCVRERPTPAALAMERRLGRMEPELHADVGQEAADVGQEAADVGQEAADVGQEAADVGQEAADVGQEAADVGQEAADVGQEAADVGREPRKLAQHEAADPLQSSSTQATNAAPTETTR